MTEFRRNVDAVLEAVERGEVQIITRYGKPFATVRPPTDHEKQQFATQGGQAP